jgi:hypothetical protein
MEAHLAQLGVLRLVNGMLIHPALPQFFKPEHDTAGVITKPLSKEEVISDKAERIEYTYYVTIGRVVGVYWTTSRPFRSHAIRSIMAV